MSIANSNMKKPLYGVGINDADYPVQPSGGSKAVCPYYRAWAGMLKRCYAKSTHIAQPTYVGCSVAAEWFSFMKFKTWMEKQNWQGKQLDKDIIHPGNKIYSSETCVFVDQSINKLFCKSNASRGKYPIGVCYHKVANKFCANISILKYRKYLGLFNSPEEAGRVYLKEKRLLILRLACCEPDIRIKQGLYRHSLTC